MGPVTRHAPGRACCRGDGAAFPPPQLRSGSRRALALAPPLPHVKCCVIPSAKIISADMTGHSPQFLCGDSPEMVRAGRSAFTAWASGSGWPRSRRFWSPPPLVSLELLFFSCLSVCLFHSVWPGLTQNGCEMCAQGGSRNSDPAADPESLPAAGFWAERL